MKNRIALILIAGGIIVFCQTIKSDSFNVIGSSLQQNENITIIEDSLKNKFSIVTVKHERTDRDIFFDTENIKKLNPQNNAYSAEDGTEFMITYGSIGYFEWETPPSKFYKIFRAYYPNKKIKSRGLVISNNNLPIGKWEYYDESGNKTVEDKDEQLPDKFDYNKVYLFLSKEGYINLVTGKGRDNIRIGYIPEKNQWGIMIKPSLENEGGYGYSYNLDGNTGKIVEKSQIIPFE